MAALYTSHAVRGAPPSPAADLPTMSDLTTWQKTELAIDYVAVALHRLSPAVTDASLALPSLGDLRNAFAGSDAKVLTAAIFDLHLEVFRALHATDPNLGKAFDLGRSLAYTCSRPEDAVALRREFQPYRLINLKEWLADLATALPAHSARGVSISLGIWQESIPDPDARPKHWQVSDDAVSTVCRQLHRQAGIWRAVLTGTKNGRDMLRPRDYASAAGRLFRRALGLLWRFLYRTFFVVPLVLAGGGYLIYLILHSGGKTGTQIIGALTAATATLGITWQGTKATLGQAAAKLEEPLWNAELDTAIGSAMTTLDRGRSAPSPGRIAAVVSPPYGPSVSDAGSS
jgi:hypothetical protein